MSRKRKATKVRLTCIPPSPQSCSKRTPLTVATAKGWIVTLQRRTLEATVIINAATVLKSSSTAELIHGHSSDDSKASAGYVFHATPALTANVMFAKIPHERFGLPLSIVPRTELDVEISICAEKSQRNRLLRNIGDKNEKRLCVQRGGRTLRLTARQSRKRARHDTAKRRCRKQQGRLRRRNDSFHFKKTQARNKGGQPTKKFGSVLALSNQHLESRRGPDTMPTMNIDDTALKDPTVKANSRTLGLKGSGQIWSATTDKIEKWGGLVFGNLLENECSLQSLPFLEGTGYLHYCCAHGFVEQVKTFLDRGADVNALYTDDDGTPAAPIHYLLDQFVDQPPEAETKERLYLILDLLLKSENINLKPVGDDPCVLMLGVTSKDFSLYKKLEARTPAELINKEELLFFFSQGRDIDTNESRQLLSHLLAEFRLNINGLTKDEYLPIELVHDKPLTKQMFKDHGAIDCDAVIDAISTDNVDAVKMYVEKGFQLCGRLADRDRVISHVKENSKVYKWIVDQMIEDLDQKGGACSICQSEDEDADVRTKKCGHVFHKECVESWFRKNLSAACRCCCCQNVLI